VDNFSIETGLKNDSERIYEILEFIIVEFIPYFSAKQDLMKTILELYPSSLLELELVLK
jgi:hypothetical protein